MMSKTLILMTLCVALLSFSSASPLQQNAYVRYAHTAPQFGRASFSANPPATVLFDTVRAGSASRYKALTPASLNFTTTFQRSGNAATPTPVSISGGLSYSVYTYATANPVGLVNAIVRDNTDTLGGSGLSGLVSARVRAANLVNIGFSATVTAQKTIAAASPEITLFSNVPYAEVSSYAAVNPGIWSLNYALSPISKRQEDDMNLTAIIAPGGCYTFWMISGGGYVTRDGFGLGLNLKRSELDQEVQHAKFRRVDAVKERAEAVEEAAEN